MPQFSVLMSLYAKERTEYLRESLKSILDQTIDTGRVYVEKILPSKMYYNLKAIEIFGFWRDIKLMFMTVFALLGKEYKGDYVPNTETSDDIKVEV